MVAEYADMARTISRTPMGIDDGARGTRPGDTRGATGRGFDRWWERTGRRVGVRRSERDDHRTRVWSTCAGPDVPCQARVQLTPLLGCTPADGPGLFGRRDALFQVIGELRPLRRARPGKTHKLIHAVRRDRVGEIGPPLWPAGP